ncbi:MAG: hypothetical protein HOP29_08695, partial [Phycisphaerales bacterium]|nr:hypothetical protein [Phycisphaerales bacterium]
MRYLRTRRIAIFAIIGVWLCVAMVVVVISVMGGFLDTLKERSRGLLSDVVIDNAALQGFPLYGEFIEHLKGALPGRIEAATSVVYNYGLLRVEDTGFTKPVQVVGVDLPVYCQVNDFGNSLFYEKFYPGTTTLGSQQQPMAGYVEGRRLVLPERFEQALETRRRSHPDDPDLAKETSGDGFLADRPGRFLPNLDDAPGEFGEEAPGAIVGSNIINERDATGAMKRFLPRGAKLVLTLLPLTRRGQISGEGAQTVVVRLADDSRTQVYEIDDKCVYVDFALVQKWLTMSPQTLEDGGQTRARASQILVSLSPGVELTAGRKMIEEVWHAFMANWSEPLADMDWALLGGVTVETWEERQRPFIAALEKEKILMTVLFALISLVTVVLIGCIFWMIVTQKTRDIGIVKSLGGTSMGVLSIFVSFGAAVGLV